MLGHRSLTKKDRADFNLCQTRIDYASAALSSFLENGQCVLYAALVIIRRNLNGVAVSTHDTSPE
jgi:hypothetical protein